ncbi:glycosyltransferase [Candidatus Bathyarchaeota archaeon]|nr:glycosyltransferase [Candidatus Bathyarchaeota archaeon]
MADPSSDDPSIAILVPVRNMARTVRDLLDSLMKLDYDEGKLEIVFVDGNSTDGTREIIGEYPVQLIDEEGKGLNAARNTGIKYSKGEILAYTDGDCIVPPNWVKGIARNFKDPGVSFVGGMVKGYDVGDFISTYMDETFFQVKPNFNGRHKVNTLYLFNFPAGCNMAFRRVALEKIDFFDERIDHGFDDLLPVEKLSDRGFSLVLDTDVMVLHQHRTKARELLKQHYNYGRGGALLLVHRSSSRLAHWFSTYLITSTFGIALFCSLIITSLYWPKMLPLNFGIGFYTFGFLVLLSFYLGTAIKSRSLKKLILYPILDVARGFFFTMGGLSQLLRIIFRRS